MHLAPTNQITNTCMVSLIGKVLCIFIEVVYRYVIIVHSLDMIVHSVVMVIHMLKLQKGDLHG